MTIIATVVGARPQFIKAATIARVLRQDRYKHVTEKLIHTGQHYDHRMSDVFFEDLGIPDPTVNLKIGSGDQGAQTGAMLAALESTLVGMRPDVVLAYGDTNSTLAAGLAAAKLNIPFVHAEAGERFFRRINVPEEVNRVASDSVASLCLTFTRRGEFHLLREGMARERVVFVGDPMYDIFLWGRQRALERTQTLLATLGLEPGEYYLSTIHRAENTLDLKRFLGLVEVLDTLDRPSVLPVHPRVAQKLKESGWRGSGNLRLIEPQAYSDFQCLLLNCRKCLTDSGGVMRETFFAQKPGIIPMINTWWPEIVESGWAFEAGKDLAAAHRAMMEFAPPNRYPEGLFGFGDAAERIVEATIGFNPGADGEAAWHWQGRVSQLPPNIHTGLTYDAYADLLAELKGKGYRTDVPTDERNGLMLRHDLEFDVAVALPLAELEQQAGMAGTYFVNPRSAAYNVASEAAGEVLRRIVELGHRIGLSVDTASEVRPAVEWLESILRERIELVVEAGGVARVLATSEPIGGIMISMRDARWLPGAPLESAAVHEGLGLVISTDPAWWGNRAKPPQQGLAELALNHFEDTERAFASASPVLRFGQLRDSH